MKKIIFGAGTYGKYAIEEYGKENIAFFVDNKKEKEGMIYEGIEIISYNHFLDIYKDFQIVIAVKNHVFIEKQLRSDGIMDYMIFPEDAKCYYPTQRLVINPYEGNGFINMTPEFIEQQMITIHKKVDELYTQNSIFNHVEIETMNRCNGGCSFCPVSVKNDIRELKIMSKELFYKIIEELEELNYSGRLALFSNNEPFLDERIIEFQKYARVHLPNARMHLFTNGTLMTLDKFKEIIPYLDEMIIDNYNQKLELIPQNQKIIEYCSQNIELRKKVTVVLRKIDEVLTTRGGDAPNARKVSYPKAKCVLPFQQMIIRPDGKISLCCNDPLGKNTLGDVSKEKLIDIWYNDNFKAVRKCLFENGRGAWKHCQGCDTFNLG